MHKYRPKKTKKDDTKMTAVGDLFAKYKVNLQPPEKKVISTFCEILEDVFGWEIPPDKIKYQPDTRTLSLHISGLYKQEIKLQQDELLAHLKARLGSRFSPTKIL